MIESNLVQNLNNLKNLPSSWEIQDFKDVVADNSGGNKKLPKSDFLDDGDIAVVDQGKNLIAGYYNNPDLIVKNEPPYVVFGDHTRAFKYVDFPFIMGADGTKVLQPKNGNCNTKYLYYFFLSINVPNTGYNRHFKYLKDLKIPLPPLAQQKKIAAILDTADAYRQKTKALIDKYDELTQSLFLDMFGDPFTNKKDFPVFKLGELCEELFLGLTSKVDYVDEGGFPLIRAKDINKGVLSFDKVKYISEEQHSKLTARRITKRGDVLISKSGTLGTCAIVDSDREFSTYESIFTVRPKADLLSNTFLVYLVRNEGFKLKLLGNQVGGIVGHLNLKMFRGFEFPLPPVSQQNDFTIKAMAIESQKAQAQASLAQADNLFNSLLQKAFKGELVK